MRTLLATTAGLLLGLPLVLAPLREAPAPPPLPTPDPPTGEVCATGCAAVPDAGSDLDAAEYRRLLAALAAGSSAGDEALDTLLFHGAAARELLAAHGTGDLDPARAALLERELSRTHALLDVRLIDAHGVERLRLGESRVPLGEKQHLHPAATHRLPPPEVSGTIRRVGVAHLWARF